MLDCDVERTRKSHIRLMFNTLAVLSYILEDVDTGRATTLRDLNDGDKGWTTLEVLCHLRDYDRIFLDRARQMVAETDPQLPGYDHERLAVERRYNEQDLATVLADLQASRAAFIAFFESLDEVQWQRAGIHPERGRFTMDDALIQVGQHDAIHLEQITRILRG
ncbi:MAG: DinB family protein [Caldilinea sp.]|nr:DinB family protein [Caldilinea sp.]MCB9115105.1 DinB family protein [Caldilineaceae bacterium]MCB9119172.1 DinB family protein [Caldilineaceae bacterium]MCB9126008.1 DinB family protein [Caldilineaceae bacterium]MCO5209611.1 DinB family protein [Caldilinea sp.]